MSDRLFSLEQQLSQAKQQAEQGLSAAQADESMPQTNRLMALEQSLDLSRQLGYSLSEVESKLMAKGKGNSAFAMQMGQIALKDQAEVERITKALDSWNAPSPSEKTSATEKTFAIGKINAALGQDGISLSQGEITVKSTNMFSKLGSPWEIIDSKGIRFTAIIDHTTNGPKLEVKKTLQSANLTNNRGSAPLYSPRSSSDSSSNRSEEDDQKSIANILDRWNDRSTSIQDKTRAVEEINEMLQAKQLRVIRRNEIDLIQVAPMNRTGYGYEGWKIYLSVTNINSSNNSSIDICSVLIDENSNIKVEDLSSPLRSKWSSSKQPTSPRSMSPSNILRSGYKSQVNKPVIDSKSNFGNSSISPASDSKQEAKTPSTRSQEKYKKILQFQSAPLETYEKAVSSSILDPGTTINSPGAVTASGGVLILKNKLGNGYVLKQLWEPPFQIMFAHTLINSIGIKVPFTIAFFPEHSARIIELLAKRWNSMMKKDGNLKYKEPAHVLNNWNKRRSSPLVVMDLMQVEIFSNLFNKEHDTRVKAKGLINSQEFWTNLAIITACDALLGVSDRVLTINESSDPRAQNIFVLIEENNGNYKYYAAGLDINTYFMECCKFKRISLDGSRVDELSLKEGDVNQWVDIVLGNSSLKPFARTPYSGRLLSGPIPDIDIICGSLEDVKAKFTTLGTKLLNWIKEEAKKNQASDFCKDFLGNLGETEEKNIISWFADGSQTAREFLKEKIENGELLNLHEDIMNFYGQNEVFKKRLIAFSKTALLCRIEFFTLRSQGKTYNEALTMVRRYTLAFTENSKQLVYEVIGDI